MRLFDCMAGVIRCRDCRFCGKREDRLLCMHPDWPQPTRLPAERILQRRREEAEKGGPAV